MKPYKTLIFFILIAIVLFVGVFVFPKDGIQIGNKITLYYPSLTELLNSKPINHSVDSLINRQLAILEEDLNDSVITPFSDTIESLLDIPPKAPKFHIDTLQTKIQKVEFPKEGKKLLHLFFKKIMNPKDVVRILHYGDSQIEGDRITSFLRNKFQKEFGGSGVGLVVPKPLVKTFAVRQEYSENWLRFPIFGLKDGKVEHNKYGALGVFCRYNSSVKDSLNNDSIVLTADVTFSQSSAAYVKDRQVKNFTIFYGNASEPILTEIYEGETLIFAKYLNTNTTLSKLQFRFSNIPKSFTVRFTGKDSPDIYAMGLDADKGVVVDNIAMRGSSGTFFNKMDRNLLRQFYDQIDLGMILLEFGGNVMPSITTEKGAEGYGKWFKSQILTLRKLKPNVPIIVMGLADMSIKEKDQFITYPYLESVRDALKKAAHDSGAYYWDMYEAMGGENSMPEWVNSDPKLAVDDYTHFTPRGAVLIGNMFFNALMYEYQIYLKK